MDVVVDVDVEEGIGMSLVVEIVVVAAAPDNTFMAAAETDFTALAMRCKPEGLDVEMDVGPLLPVEGAGTTGASMDANKLTSTRRAVVFAASALGLGMVPGPIDSLVSPDRPSVPEPMLGSDTSETEGV